jgi:hypothetical protein
MIEIAASIWTAWCVSVRLLPAAAPSVRVGGAATVWLWLSTTAFIALSAVSAFRREVAIPLWCIAALVSHLIAARTVDPWVAFTDGAAAFGDLIVRLGRERVVAAVLAVAALVFGLHVARGVFAPSLAWDDLTYHLTRPARWLQAGGYTIEPAPNAWGYSEYFPPIGDIVWAWTMMPVGNDSLLVFANVLICVTIGVSLFAAARLTGASEPAAVLAAATLVMTPSIVHYVPSGYVDPLTVALFTLSVLFGGRALLERSGADAVLMAAALGLAAGVKVSNLAVAGPGAIVVAIAVLRARLTPRARAIAALVCVSVASISAPFYWYAWRDMGSPTYPVPLDIGTTTVFPGNIWQQQIFSGPVSGRDDSLGFIFTQLFIPARVVFEQAGQFINPGPAVLLLAMPAVAGAYAWFRSRKHRVLLVYVVSAALLVTLSGLQPGAINLRSTILAASFGRFLGVPIAVVVLCAVTASSRWSSRVLILALAINCVLAVPLGWSAADGAALRALAIRVLPVLAIGGAAAVVLWRRRVPAIAVLVAVAAIAGAIALAAPVRSALRYDYFRDAAAGDTFSVNRDIRMLAKNWEAWRHMDRDVPATIAVAAGWPGMSPLGARYPLLGSRLQNRLRYIPITASGEVFDTPSRFSHPDEGDAHAWLDRLVRAGITHLAVLTPAIEGVWAREYTDVFSREFSGEVEIYRVDLAAAAARLPSGLRPSK